MNSHVPPFPTASANPSSRLSLFFRRIGAANRFTKNCGRTHSCFPIKKTTLGAFWVSLTVKNLPASRAFYEKLDFERMMGDPTQNWLILRKHHAPQIALSTLRKA